MPGYLTWWEFLAFMGLGLALGWLLGGAVFRLRRRWPQQPGERSCPFCGGQPYLKRELRDGYSSFSQDPDAWQYFFVCRSCSAQGGWAKSHSSARRKWNSRIVGGEGG